MSGPAVSRKLAINRLRDRKPLDQAIVDRFLARYEVPIIEGGHCTFLYRGEADEQEGLSWIFPGPQKFIYE